MKHITHNIKHKTCDTEQSKDTLCSMNGGQAALTAVLLFVTISLIIISSTVSIAYREARVARVTAAAAKSYAAADAGIEDAYYRLQKGKQISSIENLTIDGVQVATTIADVGGKKDIIAIGNANNHIRKVKITLKKSVGASFYYGVQIGNGGLNMENTSQVNGNVYSNGTITGNNSPVITGSASAVGTIGNPPTVNGVRTEGATPIPMPINDTLLDLWEQKAEAGGIISSPCPYKPANGTSLGPIKIICDVEIDGTNIITVMGPVWITGNLDIKNSAQMNLASSYAGNSDVIVVDNPTNRLTSSKITLQNSAQINGSGTTGSYVLVISRNNSSESGGGEVAIDIKNTSNAPVYYAPHGKIEIQNNTALKEATAYSLSMKNSAQVTYETGLANVYFSSGPTGGWEAETWLEVE